MKYVLVSGGVISGVGKGIIASSTGLLLKTAGLSVSSIKIDPYLNPDAGLMNVSLGPPRLPLFTVHVSLTNVFIASGVRSPAIAHSLSTAYTDPFDRHGECFVLDDGGEADLDLGNYERYLGVTLGRDNNITTGKIYQHVIDKERRGDYLGKTGTIVVWPCAYGLWG